MLNAGDSISVKSVAGYRSGLPLPHGLGILFSLIACQPGGVGNAPASDAVGSAPVGEGTNLPPRPGTGGTSGRGPQFDPVESAQKAPAPLSGGTLRVQRDGKLAVAADPDRDQVFVVDLVARRLALTVDLHPGDEPGRHVEDSLGRVHVVLRQGGAVATIDPRSGAILGRRAVCPAPRGLAYDAASDRLYVACAGGELVTLAAGNLTGAPLRTLHLDLDLRDVVVKEGNLYVSRFRSAELLVVGDGGTIQQRLRPAAITTPGVRVEQGPTPRGSGPATSTLSPAVAWRTLAAPNGDIWMVHQRGLDSEVGTTPGSYAGGPCSAVVSTVISTLRDNGLHTSLSVSDAVLPVDLAISRDGTRIGVVAAGNARLVGHSQILASLTTTVTNSLDNQGCGALPNDGFSNPPAPPDVPRRDAGPGGENGATGDPSDGHADAGTEVTDDPPLALRQPTGEAVALAFDGQGNLLVQTREPATLQIATQLGLVIPLSVDRRADTGHAIFHSNSGAGVACASCHPEGGEDGRVWQFTKIGSRRTQSLRGGIIPTAPYHWNGDIKDMGELMQEVFVGRMSGPRLAANQIGSLQNWLGSIPAAPLSPIGDAESARRGRTLFESPAVGCASCHSGPLFTNNQNIDVGTGAPFQVPSLRGVSWRAPFMHDGCAATLRDRFAGCGGAGDAHGVTSSLSSAQLDDLVAYLNTI